MPRPNELDEIDQTQRPPRAPHAHPPGTIAS